VFVSSLHQWQKTIHERTILYHDFFTSDHVAFIQVLTLEPEKMRQTMYFSKEVKKMGYNLVGSIVNRATPPWDEKSLQMDKWSQGIKDIYSSYVEYFERPLHQLENLKLKDYVLLPELRHFVSEFDDVVKFSYYLNRQVKL
jgi:hypothetical protein